MSKTNVAIIAVVAFIAGAVMGVLGYVTVTGGSGEASVDAADRAPTLSLDDADVTAEAATEEATMTEEATATEEAVATEEAAARRVLFRITPDASEARFTLEEDLRAIRTTVVGTTNQLAGDIIVDLQNPANSEVGGIVINARTLVTDNTFRNSAIRGQILRSEDDRYEFIEFTPTALNGLPTEPVSNGETISFEIVGDLTIIEVTQPVTFSVSVTVSEDGSQLSGNASTEILWADYNISIPSVPGVANITPEVTLELEFVAALVDSE